ncbi:MAG: bifunctional precorrin-2 dehydrogenase/sirohydrochlorin ferrochelatase [Clostridia bacterium]|jgi:precorrin-2 dehydrogenase/sirohydrochlorin ferrochelatase|nr:bifunctional precorrin-2 dehydrogenase/sirohydrochlorin ferrochelatase [Clostridia bacterium]MDH7573426.1 bifunctional precorrin-2 dehydrogenase/sirohydrochlorin ferrochelatase [Clostridia bacterium]
MDGPKSYYPVCLDLEHRRCLVVGGGKVAERRVVVLLKCGAEVEVVSPTLTPELQEMAERGQIVYHQCAFHAAMLEGMTLVIAATDHSGVNAQVAQEARRRGLLVNVVDEPEQGNFLVPATLRQGPLVVSVSTSGLSPVLARRIRDELARELGPEYAELLLTVGRLRRWLREEVSDARVRRELWFRLVDKEPLDRLLAGRKELEQRVRQWTSSWRA